MSIEAQSTQPIKIFVSYVREDEVLCKELEKQLIFMKQSNLISSWHNRDIQAGQEWKREIDMHLNTAQIILLLISSSFMASDYCYSIEMKRALERHNAKEARVIPIILRPVHWETAPFGKLRALPTKDVPVISSGWHSLDEAFLDVAEGILKVVEELQTYNMPSHSVPVQIRKEAVAQPLFEKKHMDTTHSSDAIFLFNEPLLDSREFYGRIRERVTLIRRTVHGASTSIVGPYKSGTSWLLQYLKLLAPTELGPNFHVVYLNATSPSCTTVPMFTTIILQKLGLTTDEASQGLARLEGVVRDLELMNQTLVVCIDEFEGFSNKREFDLNFFTSLRSLTQDGLVLVVVSKRPLNEVIGHQGATSAFFNIFEQLLLKPFILQEAKSFVQAKSIQAKFTEQEAASLLKYGKKGPQQWSPLRLQLAGRMLLDDKTLAATEGSHYYRPDDSDYWDDFEDRLEEKYKVVMQ